jgi:hypothetical protein
MRKKSKRKSPAKLRISSRPSATCKLDVGMWKHYTYQAGKLAKTTSEMNRYNLDLLAVTETRWTTTALDNHETGVTLIINKKQTNTYEVETHQ